MAWDAGGMTQSDIPVAAGSTVVPAMLSPVISGLVRTWTDTGTALWRLEDPALLSQRQFRGALARTMTTRGRYAEVGMLSAKQGALFLPERPHSGQDGAQATGTFAALTPAEPPLATPGEVRDEFARSVVTALVVALQSQTDLVLAPGGWDTPDTPYVAFYSDDDAASLVVETAPQPQGIPAWSDYLQPNQPGCGVRLEIGDNTLVWAAILATEAFVSWDVAPWDVTFTTGR